MFNKVLLIVSVEVCAHQTSVVPPPEIQQNNKNIQFYFQNALFSFLFQYSVLLWHMWVHQHKQQYFADDNVVALQ